MMRVAAIVLLLIPAVSTFGQDDIMVFGTIKDQIMGVPVSDGRVVVASERGVRDTALVDSAGTYEFHLDYGRLWQMRYEAPGRVTKLIAIDSRNIPAEERVGGHGMNVNMSLFIEEPGKDYAAFKEPMSIARYVDSLGNFGWDLAMAQRMNERIAELLPDSMTFHATASAALPPASEEPARDPLKWVLGSLLLLIIAIFGMRALRGANGGSN